MKQGPRRAGRQEGARRLAAFAWTWPAAIPEYMRELADAPRRRPSEGRAGAHRPDVLDADEEARRRRLRGVRPTSSSKASKQAGKKQYLVPYFIASHPGSDLDAMIDLALFLKRNDYRPDQVQDFIPSPFDIAACMYHTGLDPFTKKPVYIAKHLRDRKLQRALMQFFKPENYFECARPCSQAGRQDLIGSGCDCLIPGQPAEGGHRGAHGAERESTPTITTPSPIRRRARSRASAAYRTRATGRGGRRPAAS